MEYAQLLRVMCPNMPKTVHADASVMDGFLS